MKKILLTILAVLALGGMAMAQTAPSDINLHRNEDGSWSFIMPGRNLVMSTETFSSNDPNGYTLAGVPEGWLVIAAGDTVTITDGVTTPITEGAPVTIVPTGNLRRIKSITLEDAPTPLDNTSTAWADGKYAVPAGGLTYSDAVTVNGEVTLVLTNGETLTLNNGISLAEGATLTIEGNGTMAVNGTNGGTGADGSVAISGAGMVVMNGGTFTAKGGNGGNSADNSASAPAGSGANAINAAMTINGGTVSATGGNGGGGKWKSNIGGAGIGGTLTVNGGTVSAIGGNGGSHRYGGKNGGAGVSGTATINGGTVRTTGGNGGTAQQDNLEGNGSNGQGFSSTLTLGAGVTLYSGTDNTGTVLDGNTGSSREYSGSRAQNMYAE